AAAREQLPVAHPENAEIAGITIGQLSGPSTTAGVSRRNAVIVSTGELDWNRPESWTGALDRSPCGTGTCAKMATLHAKGLLPLERDFVHEGILGTIFAGRLVGETRVGKYAAVIPTISGRAWITGFAQYVVDADDPFPTGFTVGDIWGKTS
ncbi:MAG: proline racemase family protein, partial [Candidatus Acidiferrales bacterium]